MSEIKKGLVTVITPTFNCGKYIKDAITSVIAQTYGEWEMIIVDDCSTDDTESVVKSFTDDRIKYIKLEENKGTAYARNVSMDNAMGEFYAFLDADDIWEKDKLEKQVSFMNQNGYNFSATSYEKVTEDGNKKCVVTALEKVDYKRMLLDSRIGNSAVMYRADVLGDIRVPLIRKRNDLALWLQILKREKYCYGLNEVLTVYRKRKGSISGNKFSLIKYHWILYRKIEKLSIIRSAYYIVVLCFIKLFKIK